MIRPSTIYICAPFISFVPNQWCWARGCVKKSHVNNAGIPGAHVDSKAMADANVVEKGGQIDWSKVLTETYEQAEAGIKTNYYGAKELIKALIPHLQLSNSPKIVNVSASMGKLE
ncbi:(+)-neomenthol dehydrogenase-like protein, partial [Trifolium pratense]